MYWLQTGHRMIGELNPCEIYTNKPLAHWASSRSLESGDPIVFQVVSRIRLPLYGYISILKLTFALAFFDWQVDWRSQRQERAFPGFIRQASLVFYYTTLCFPALLYPSILWQLFFFPFPCWLKMLLPFSALSNSILSFFSHHDAGQSMCFLRSCHNKYIFDAWIRSTFAPALEMVDVVYMFLISTKVVGGGGLNVVAKEQHAMRYDITWTAGFCNGSIRRNGW